MMNMHKKLHEIQAYIDQLERDNKALKVDNHALKIENGLLKDGFLKEEAAVLDRQLLEQSK